jgi:hypothetical protein
VLMLRTAVPLGHIKNRTSHIPRVSNTSAIEATICSPSSPALIAGIVARTVRLPEIAHIDVLI